jgi:hypothetical protein
MPTATPLDEYDLDIRLSDVETASVAYPPTVVQACVSRNLSCLATCNGPGGKTLGDCCY